MQGFRNYKTLKTLTQNFNINVSVRNRDFYVKSRDGNNAE